MTQPSFSTLDSAKLNPWFESLTLRNEKKEENKKIEFTRRFFYQWADLSLKEIQDVIEEQKEIDLSKLKKNIKLTVYGASPLHWAILNPDKEVFEYAYQLYLDLGINPQNFEHKSEYRKTKIQNITVLEHETFLNLAFKLRDHEKILSLQEKKLTSFAIPKLPEVLAYNYYFDSFTKDSTLLSYILFCLYNNVQNVQATDKIQDITQYYFNFGSQVGNLEKEIPTLFNSHKLCKQLSFFLIFYEPLYYKDSLKTFLPLILNQYLEDIFKKGNSFMLYNTRHLGVWEHITQNLERHANSSLILKIANILKKKEYKTLTQPALMQDLEKFENKIKILFDKKILEETLQKPKSSSKNLIKI